jgi:hypothetical protein
MRWRVIERLVETASPVDVQIRMMDEAHLHSGEVVQRFWDWWEFVPTLDTCGALSPEAQSALSRVNDAFVELDRVSGYLWTGDLLWHRPEWGTVRRAAREALEAFELMGLPVPCLTDADFNQPRADAP